MKHLVKLFIIPLFAFCACSGQEEDVWESNEPPKDSGTHPVEVNLGSETVQALAELDITEVGVYVYQKDSLVFGENVAVSNGNLQINLPLGEALQTFVVANAGQMIDTKYLSEVAVRLDAGLQKQVYISDIVDFTSDNSVSSLNLELKRLIGQAVFQPKETDGELALITQFDQLNLTFTNVGVAYKVQTGECVQEDVTIQADRTTGFSASIYSLPTIDEGSRTAIDVVYFKDGQEVNRTNSPLDTGIAFEPSKRSVVYMAILEEGYLANGWTRSSPGAALTGKIFTIMESEF